MIRHLWDICHGVHQLLRNVIIQIDDYNDGIAFDAGLDDVPCICGKTNEINQCNRFIEYCEVLILILENVEHIKQNPIVKSSIVLIMSFIIETLSTETFNKGEMIAPLYNEHVNGVEMIINNQFESMVFILFDV